MRKIFALLLIILFLISIPTQINGLNHDLRAEAIPHSLQESSNLLEVNLLHLEVKKGNTYVKLEDLIEESQKVEEKDPNPKIANGSSVRVQVTYSLPIGRSESLVIRKFSVDIYKDITGEADQLNKSYTGISNFRYLDPAEIILPPNSTRSDIVEIPALTLVEIGTYKFVFRVEFHIYNGDELPKSSFYPENYTFDLVKGYASPPYIILYVFYFVSILFIGVIVIGIYGDRKYREDL